MATWQLQDLDGHLGELIDAVEQSGPQVISRDGVEKFAVIPIDEWKPTPPKGNLIEVLMSGPKFEIPLPDRKKWRVRKPPEF